MKQSSGKQFDIQRHTHMRFTIRIKLKSNQFIFKKFLFHFDLIKYWMNFVFLFRNEIVSCWMCVCVWDENEHQLVFFFVKKRWRMRKIFKCYQEGFRFDQTCCVCVMCFKYKFFVLLLFLFLLCKQQCVCFLVSSNVIREQGVVKEHS